jgi:hypothetical protein
MTRLIPRGVHPFRLDLDPGAEQPNAPSLGETQGVRPEGARRAPPDPQPMAPRPRRPPAG